VLEGKENEVGVAAKAEDFHDVMFVKLDGLRAEIEETGDFLDRTAFAEELDDVALARSKCAGEVASAGPASDPVFGSEFWSDIGLAS
jgi:hypothetical protein